MNGYLADTNVISEMVKARPEERVLRFLEENEDQIHLSVLTIGEIEKGILSHKDPRRRSNLRHWLDDEIKPIFADRILTIDLNTAISWSKALYAASRPVPIMDSLLAATAVHHGLTLATRNVKDVKGTGVQVFNPWED